MKLVSKKKSPVKRQDCFTNKIICGDCFKTIEDMNKKSYKVDMVLTSPPYNNSKSAMTEHSRNNRDIKYDVYHDTKSNEEYYQWTVDLFKRLDSVLAENGVILYNMSYGTNEDASASCDNLMELMYNVSHNTQFMVSDIIVWKKKSASPSNTSSNKCTRIVEFIFVICRKDERQTYISGKQVKSVNEKTGQKFYSNMFNFIEAPNNDGPCSLNKATYSTELVLKLLEMYAPNKTVTVFDPFIGTGTTAVACKKFGCNYVGCELSENQCKWAEERLND